jgi:hypothetical protein
MQAKFEPFRFGSKLSQSGKHKKPRRESRLFSFQSRVFWGFLLTAAPNRSSLPARSTSRIARFLVPTPARKAKSLGLSRLTGAGGLTETGLQRVLFAALFESLRDAPGHAIAVAGLIEKRFVVGRRLKLCLSCGRAWSACCKYKSDDACSARWWNASS